MDPKKTWVCCEGHRYTDFNRTYGEIDCPYCLEDEFKKKKDKQKAPMSERTKNAVNGLNLVKTLHKRTVEICTGVIKVCVKISERIKANN